MILVWHVGKSATIKETAEIGVLNVLGYSTLKSHLFVGKTATITGPSSIQGILDVNGSVTMKSSLSVGKSAR